MNKPPERIRLVMNRYGCILPDLAPIYEWDREHPDCTPHTEHFYTLEEPMTQKTENLTVQEAWAAMARGECVKSGSSCLRRINDTELVFYDNDKSEWVKCFTIGMSPYSIVPDPSKPKEVEDLYKEDKSVAITCFVLSRSEEAKATGLIEFMERNFQRKP